MRFLQGIFCLLVGFSVSNVFALESNIPACRLVNQFQDEVSQTLERAASAYSSLGWPLPFSSILVNSTSAATVDDDLLRVFIVADAFSDAVDAKGCKIDTVSIEEQLDFHSVRGGCVVKSGQQLEMRCSADAVNVFSDGGQQYGRANPALLYLLAHELAHIHQRRRGEFSGRTVHLELSDPQSIKLGLLREHCAPIAIQREEEADAMALQVMKKLVQFPPYREPVFSEQGSMLWVVDQLAIATNAWVTQSIEREFLSMPTLHSAFIPTELPTPDKVIAKNAQLFVCDVLKGKTGMSVIPARSRSHPSIEQRLSKVAAILSAVAVSLPASTNESDFKPVAQLQQGLSPIFSFIYRETGKYLESLEGSLCSIVNSEKPIENCE